MLGKEIAILDWDECKTSHCITAGFFQV